MSSHAGEISAGGIRHVVFNCPDGYPVTGVSLEDLYADCEFVRAYFCLDQPSWRLMPIQPGCHDRRRV